MDNQKRNRLLVVLFIGVLMAALDIAIVGPALPTIRDYFQIDDRAATWLFTIYVLFHLIGTPLMAKLSDLMGRRSIYIADLLLFAIGSLAVALAPSFTVVLIGRAIQGFGSGGIFPVASAVIGDTFPPEKRGSALGLIGAVFGLAFIIGPIIGGVLLLVGWRWLFAINLPILLLVMVMAPPLLPTITTTRHPFDWLGMSLLAIILGSLTYGLNHLDTTHLLITLTDLHVWPFIALVIVLLPAFILVERRAVDPIIHLRLFRTRQIVLASVLSIGAGLDEAGMVFIPALAVESFGISKSSASFLLMPLVLALAVGAPIAGRFLDKMGSKLVVMAGTSILAAGIFLLSFSAGSWVMFVSAGVIIGFGLAALLGAPIRYIMLNEARMQERAVAQALITIFTSVGQLVGGATVGAIIASAGGGLAGYRSAYSLIGVAAVALVLVSLGLKNRSTELSTVAERESSVQMTGSVSAK
jgi:EmrB/QacA subfamily drug resistance transporter